MKDTDISEAHNKTVREKLGCAYKIYTCPICKWHNSEKCSGMTHEFGCENFEKKDICGNSENV